MMRHLPFLIVCVLPLAAVAAAPLLPDGPNANQQLAEARKEAATSALELDRLNKAARDAQDELSKAKAEQAAAAAAIIDAEARIAEADAETRLADAQAALGKARLDRQRAPISALLGGLISIGREPPILALFDGTSTDELVRVKALVDTIDPVIRQRTASLTAEYKAQRTLSMAAQAGRTKLAENRTLLIDRQRAYAALEKKANARVAVLTSQALTAGDRVLADREGLVGAESAALSENQAMAEARKLALLGLAQPRPIPGDAALPANDFGYTLPVDAAVSEGVGSVNKAGIIARGTRFDTRRGAPVIAPASGTIRFAGPFRRSDGLIIIDHGQGRTSLLVGVATTLAKNQKVEIGQPIGIATGPVRVEFRDNGRIMSPAFIAASSPPLSNATRTR